MTCLRVAIVAFSVGLVTAPLLLWLGIYIAVIVQRRDERIWGEKVEGGKL